MDYYISTYNCTSVDVGYTYLALGFTTFDTYTETPGWKSPTSGFHGSPTNKQTHTFNATPSGDAYPQIYIRAELTRTGSGIPPEGYLITASNTLVNEEIFRIGESPHVKVFPPNISSFTNVFEAVIRYPSGGIPDPVLLSSALISIWG